MVDGIATAMVDGIATAMGFAMMQMAQMHGEYVDEYVEYVEKKRPNTKAFAKKIFF